MVPFIKRTLDQNSRPSRTKVEVLWKAHSFIFRAVKGNRSLTLYNILKFGGISASAYKILLLTVDKRTVNFAVLYVYTQRFPTGSLQGCLMEVASSVSNVWWNQQMSLFLSKFVLSSLLVLTRASLFSLPAGINWFVSWRCSDSAEIQCSNNNQITNRETTRVQRNLNAFPRIVRCATLAF